MATLGGALAALAPLPASADFLNPSDFPQAEEIIVQSLVRIGRGEDTGSGFVVSENSDILTAWHVLEKINRRSTIQYVKTIYSVSFNALSGRPGCTVLALLVGASDYRDVAVLRVREGEWERERREGGCLAHVEPADLHLEADLGDVPAEAESVYDKDVYPVGFPSSCLSGTGLPEIPCELRGFSTGRMNVNKREDEIGLMQLNGSVHPGMSGGPVVAEDGKVLGMIIVKDWDADSPVIGVLPSNVLARALWTFGVAIDPRRGEVLGDHYELMLDYITRRDDMLEALESFEAMYGFLSIPELARDEAFFRKVEIAPLGEVAFPVIVFERRWPNAPNPDRFDVSYTCKPADGRLEELFLGPTSERAFRDASTILDPLAMYPQQGFSGPDGATGSPPRARYEATPVSTSSNPRPILRRDLLSACAAAYKLALRELQRAYERDPDAFTAPQRETLADPANLPEIDESAFSEIIFQIEAVFEEVVDGVPREKSRHRYNALAIPVAKSRDLASASD